MWGTLDETPVALVLIGKPLLIVHGWPGSVWEFYKIIPMLTDPAAYGGRDEDAFEVTAPSIPGYGFSEAPHRTGKLSDIQNWRWCKTH